MPIELEKEKNIVKVYDETVQGKETYIFEILDDYLLAPKLHDEEEPPRRFINKVMLEGYFVV